MTALATMTQIETHLSSVNKSLRLRGYTLAFQLIDAGGSCYLVDRASGCSIGRIMSPQAMADTLHVILATLPRLKVGPETASMRQAHCTPAAALDLATGLEAHGSVLMALADLNRALEACGDVVGCTLTWDSTPTYTLVRSGTPGDNAHTARGMVRLLQLMTEHFKP